ncbi:DNA polymerase kappa [Abortiporus biennis]
MSEEKPISKLPPQTQDSESLLKRLAGPSTTKAGLAKDQTEINKVIAEASKGSKFYENEKRKDKDLTEKIAKLLKHKNEILKNADIAHVEHSVDQIIDKMEAQRDLSQVIVHVDMDAFYASVELLDKPELAGKSFAVGGGVLTTASYEARKFGIRSGMPEYIAKKLHPELIVLPNNFSRYSEMSKKVMSIFRRYDSNMCAASVDEGYLNITEYCEEHGLTPEECVQQMRETVEKETKLTVSAGIAPNTLLAKICSDKNKPNGQFKLDFNAEAIKSFMKDLSIRKVPGVGRVNERLLDSIGIKTCGDIYTHRATISLMDKQFGLHYLLQTYLGIGSNVVQPYQREERKSIGAERTFHALGEKEKIFAKLQEVAAELEGDMESGGWTGKTVTLKYKLDTYQVYTRAKSFDHYISGKKEELFNIGKELLLPELPLRLRLIGLRVTKLKDLKVDEDKKRGGIKRFFESTINGPPSPNKRRKLIETKADIEEPSLTQDGYEFAMPGFIEHEHEEDGDEEQNPEISKPSSSASIFQSRQKPASAVGSSNSSSSKPVSRNLPTTKNSTFSESESSHQCPICSKTIVGSNQDLNAHIDFCLSKGAIQEAQAEGSMQRITIKPDNSPGKGSNGSDHVQVVYTVLSAEI